MQTITLPMPDDWHLHLRDGDMLKRVLPFTTRHFRRAIVMPNLTPPVVKTSDAIAYEQRIQNASDNDSFKPLMTLYMTENTDPSDVKKGFEEGIVTAIKLYPAGATTNSDAGVKNMEAIYSVLETMQAIGMPLLVHGEVVDSEIDIFDREAVFIETKLKPVREEFPELKVVFEHITTKDGVDYVQSCNDGYTAATVTPHHLVINRNAMLVGGIKPHYYCLPVAKREEHRLALRKAVTSGDKRFFLGTDSAPHTQHAKESSCGCAGIFNVANALSVIAQVFDDENALEHLKGFVSRNGPAFYGLPVNESSITLSRIEEALPQLDPIETNEGNVTVFDPLMDLYWQVTS